MRTTKFQTVFDRVVRKLGRDPLAEIPQDMSRALVEHINERVRTICDGWMWPEWTVTEERAFRPVWNSTEAYLKVSSTDGLPDEVFYLGAAYVVGGDFGTGYGYYRVKADAPADPPIGTVPTNATYWELIDPVDTFIAYDQRDRRAIGQVLEVYSGNPRVPTGSMRGRRRFNPSEKGIDVPGGGTTVFITQKLPVPTYTMVPYVVGKTYSRGETVFDPTTGECYQAITTTTAAPSDATKWNWVPFLAVWTEYVCNGAFADTMLEFDQGGNGDIQAKVVLAQAASERAEKHYEREVDTLVAQGQVLKYNFGGCNYSYESAVCVSGLVELIS
jgi:hypothetical protein